jgi:hypothetical protein
MHSARHVKHVLNHHSSVKQRFPLTWQALSISPYSKDARSHGVKTCGLPSHFSHFTEPAAAAPAGGGVAEAAGAELVGPGR